MAKIGQYNRYRICMLLCLFWGLRASAQNNYHLLVTPVDKSPGFMDSLQLKTSFIAKLNCVQYVQQLPLLLAAKGYISASVDSIKEDSFAVRIHLFVGDKYTWASLRATDGDWIILNQLGYRKELFNNKPFNPDKVKTVYDKLLDYYAANGHPFAKINLDSIELNKGLVTAKLHVDKGLQYFIDTIRLYGPLKISNNFLQHYLDIGRHSLYDQTKLEKVNQRLTELPYAQQSQPWDMTMLHTGALLNVYLQPKHSNEINAIIGFLPSNQELGGKLLLTGEVNLNLKNSFGAGETIGLNWQQLQSQSPRLNLAFQRPYLFNSPFGLDFSFDLYKKDSSFLNINARLGVQYIFSPQQTGRLMLQTASTNLLDVDTLQVMATKRLPDMIDVSSLSLALQYDFNNTNYRLNPRSGNELQFIISAGNKNVRKNNAILQIKDDTFNYNTLYDSVKLKSYQVRVRVAAAHYFPVGKQAAVKTALTAGIYQSPSYFSNELFQIGGYKLLRGFDEESIYTNRFAVGTLEYRYLLAQNSYFFGFTDVGWANYQSISLAFTHSYIGAGIGLAFETRSGIFNISYAAGKRDDLKLDLQQSKIHLGFVSVF